MGKERADDMLRPLGEILVRVSDESELAWLYLPAAQQWSLTSLGAVLESEEVPPEENDLPDAGVPALARQYKLKEVLPVTTVQDIVANARSQDPTISNEGLLRALMYYYEHDAFMKLPAQQSQ